MKAYDVPGLAIGIVAGDKLIYANGLGVTGKTRKAIGGANVSLAGDAYVVPRGLPISC